MGLAQASFTPPPPVPPPVATIIDDDPLGRMEIALRVSKIGWTPRVIETKYGSDFEGLLREAESQTNIVICDQRLNHSNYLSRNGIVVARQLLKRKVPTLLISQAIDDIKPFASELPILSRDDLQSQATLSNSFKESRLNAYESESADDRFYRSIVKVADVDHQSQTARFLVTGWDKDELVTTEIRWIPERLLEFLIPGRRMLARARLHARAPSAVALRDFELAPEPDPDDGLA